MAANNKTNPDVGKESDSNNPVAGSGGNADNNNSTVNAAANNNNNNSNNAANTGQDNKNPNNTNNNNSNNAANTGQDNKNPNNTNNNGGNASQGGGGEAPVQMPPGSGSPQPGNTPALGDNQQQSGKKNSSSLPADKVSEIAGSVGVVIILILLGIICFMCKRRRKKPKVMDSHYMPSYGSQGNQQWQSPSKDHAVNMPPSGGWGKDSSGPYSGSDMGLSEPSPSFQLGFSQSTFTYEELAAATNGFDQANMLGQGGFGYVHKGVLANGKEVAVKSLKSGSGQGDREFHAEVEIITRVHHKHLVTLVGYCIARGQRMLVYEFVPNNTLEHHLHKINNPPLDFSTRLRIALGSAKGLSYLHEDCHPRIIHRDIKASNILLQNNFEAMVADFGLAKLTTDTNTHVSTRVMGTFGYLAPEYASSGKLTEKSDVFSFGVMLLEIITGRRPVDPDMKYMEDSLVDWSRPLLTKALDTGDYHELADPRLEGNYNAQEMQRMVACAAASIRHSSKKRPKMSQIVRALEGTMSLEDLNDAAVLKAGQNSSFNSPDTSSESSDSHRYSVDLRRFRQMAFDTQDFASSEYEGTRDYGMNSSMSSGLRMHEP